MALYNAQPPWNRPSRIQSGAAKNSEKEKQLLQACDCAVTSSLNSMPHTHWQQMQDAPPYARENAANCPAAASADAAHGNKRAAECRVPYSGTGLKQ